MTMRTAYFKLRANRALGHVTWRNRHTLYRGERLSAARRTVRLFAPNPTEREQYVDLPSDWETAVQ